MTVVLKMLLTPFIFLSNVWDTYTQINSLQQNAKEDILDCLQTASHCKEISSRIENFMDKLSLWNKFINTEKKFIEAILQVTDNFPSDKILQIYRFVENDLIKEFEINSLLTSLKYIKENRNVYDKYIAHHLYIINKYKNKGELLNPVFTYKSTQHSRIRITRYDIELINDASLGIQNPIISTSRRIYDLVGDHLNPNTREKKKQILQLVEMIRIEEDINIDDEDKFITILLDKIPIHRFEIEKFHNLIKNAITKQRTALSEITTFFEDYENANYIQAWNFIENFIDAYSLETIKEFNRKEIEMIFYNRFTKGENSKFNKLVKLIHDRNKNYQRTGTMENIFKYLTTDANSMNKYTPMMSQLIQNYDIGWTVTDYITFKNKFLAKDIFVKDNNIYIIFQYYLKCKELRKGTIILNEVYEKILKNPQIHFFEVYPYIYSIIQIYKLGETAITFDGFLIKVREHDEIINEIVLMTIYEYVVKIIHLNERMKARSSLIHGFKKYSYSKCFYTSKDFDNFINLYEIDKIKNFNHDTIHTYFNEIDMNMVSLEEIEYLVKYLPLCYKYQKLIKLRDPLLKILNANNNNPLFSIVEKERYILAYEFTDYDVENIHNFYDKVKSIDEIIIISELDTIYSSVLSRSKLNRRNMNTHKILRYLGNNDPKLTGIIKELEELISDNYIILKKLINVQYLKNLLFDLDLVSVNKENEIIFNALIKYKSFIRRRKYIYQLIKYLKSNNEINDYEMSLYMNPLISEYQIKDIDIAQKNNFIDIIIKYDEIIDLNDLDLLHRSITNYMKKYKRYSHFESLFKYEQENQINKFIYFSDFVKKYVDAYKIKHTDVSSFDIFISKVKTIDEIIDETKLLKVYSLVKSYAENSMKTEGFKLIKTVAKTESPVNLIKMEPYLEYLNKYYAFDNDTLSNFICFYKTTEEKDKYFDESNLSAAFSHLKFYFYSKIMRKDKKKLIEYNDASHSVHLREKYLNRVIKNYDLYGKKLQNMLTFYKIIIKNQYISSENNAKQIYPSVSARLKIYQEDK